MTAPRRYRAFISYSHGDEAVARWLQRALEGYRLPPSLRQSHPGLPARLYPIFRDRDELASGHDLSDSIRHAMDDSEALIVICSPAAAASRWVNEEIHRFRDSGRGYRIFCCLVAGSPDPAAADCAFPPALLRDRDGAPLHEPLAADATAHGDGRRNAMLKIAAGLLDVGVDELKRRDAQRQARLWSGVAAGAMFVAALTVGLALYAFKQRQESEVRRQQAEALIGFMLGDLREKLEPIGKLDLLDSVGDKAMGYFATLGERGTPREMLARAVALKQIGDVRFNQGKLEPALQSFEQALAQSRTLHEAEPENNDYLFELGQAEFWVGYVAWERGELDKAEAAMHDYLRYSLELRQREPGNADYTTEVAYAYSNLGSLSRARGDAKTALAYFGLCREINERQLAATPGDPDLTMTLAETSSWIGSTKVDDGDLRAGEQAFAEVARLLQPLHDRGASARASDLLGRNTLFHANVQMELGNAAAARSLVERGLAIYADLTAKDPQNAAWSRSAQRARLLQLSLYPHSDWVTAHERELDQVIARLAALRAQDPTNAGFLVDISQGLRLKSLRALVAGEVGQAATAARQAHDMMAASFASTDYSPLRLVELAKAAALLGTTQAASGDLDSARATWLSAAELLDQQTNRTFDFIPVRRLLALDLDQGQVLQSLEARLQAAGYRDTRMDPAHNRSGAFGSMDRHDEASGRKSATREIGAEGPLTERRA
jgi:tetratricopeptide (TPR) repeat protein